MGKGYLGDRPRWQNNIKGNLEIGCEDEGVKCNI
jgi:hypothetical protein